MMSDLETRISQLLTRRSAVAFGGTFAALSGLIAGLGMEDADAKKRKRRRRKNKKRKKGKGGVNLVAANMTGDKEVPGPGDPDGVGSGECTVKGNEICCTFQYTPDPASPITGVHIHEGGPDDDGDIVVDFEGQLDNCVIADEGLAAQIKNNPENFYANIHTDDFPDGAVRDQLAKA
jgi:hypothetical protein